jgi:hypothetical protein
MKGYLMASRGARISQGWVDVEATATRRTARAQAKDLESVGIRLRLDRDGGSCYDRTMRAFICEVDETGLRRILSEDALAGDGVRRYTRCRFARPTTVAWALLDDGDAESIRSAVATGHHDVACGLLLNRAIELLSIAAAMPEATLPA